MAASRGIGGSKGFCGWTLAKFCRRFARCMASYRPDTLKRRLACPWRRYRCVARRRAGGGVAQSVKVHAMEQSILPRKFHDPDWTATREARASVALRRLETLWINTGTLCNITCRNCYIESNPRNDRLVYLTAAEAATYFEEITRLQLGTREVGFTGGEPFMNPEFLLMLEDALDRGFEVLVLTNAMQP